MYKSIKRFCFCHGLRFLSQPAHGCFKDNSGIYNTVSSLIGCVLEQASSKLTSMIVVRDEMPYVLQRKIRIIWK